MTQQKETDRDLSGNSASGIAGKQQLKSKRVTDHLANERTFLAWIRTGLATITFGFVVERFGLVLRELGLKNAPIPLTSIHYSSFIGITLTILGVILIVIALANFLQIRSAIDKEEFHPQATFAIILTILASLVGLLLAFYLWTTA
jgi:putative membrane protein